MTVWALLDSEGTPRDHSLTEYDARIYAERHNRALLRRAVKDVRQNQNHSRIQPLLGPGVVGVSGTF